MAIRRTVAIMGTAGVGNSSMLLKLLLDDPRAFGLATRAFYLQAQQNICLYNHVIGDTFCVRFVEADEFSDESVILFADRKTEDGTPTQHTGASVIFTSFRPSIFKEITKFGRRKVLPVWSAHEQSIRSNVDAALANTDPVPIIEEVITAKGELVRECFFKAWFGVAEDAVLDAPHVWCAFSFASPYVLRRLLTLNNNMLVTKARYKYDAGTSRYRGENDGNVFGLLCLHGFKVSDVEFLALPLTKVAKRST
jgi:hypothetical protein